MSSTGFINAVTIRTAVASSESTDTGTDFVEFLKLDYGTFQMKSLSVGFKGMLLDILNNSTLGESEKEDVENKALFCL